MKSSESESRLREKTGGVFYLHGADDYRKERFADLLLVEYLDPATRDFNFDPFRGSEVNLENLASAIRTPPLMAEWRVVQVRDTQVLASSSKARDLLVEVAEAPPEGLVLVLMCTPPAASSARFYRDLERAAQSFQFDPPDEDELPAWLMERSREGFGREMDEPAARALAQAIGANLSVLDRELEKLSTLVAQGESITRAVVELAGTRLPRQDRWEWFDLVGERRFEEAVKGLPILLDHGESGVSLVAGLGTHLLRVGLALEGGASAVAPFLPPRARRWLGRRYVEQSRGWETAGVVEALEGLLRADELLKSSRIPAIHLIETWLLERMAGRRAA